MSEPIWNKFLTERDKAVFGTSGYGARGGFGKRPALLIIDVNYAFCDERPMPILESIKRWRNSCGEDAWVAMPYLRSLIDKAHAKGIPVIYTTGVRREDNWDNGSWSWKNSRSDEDDKTVKPPSNLDGNEIVAEIAPAPQDIVVLKQKPSGFFGTNMASYLTLLGCDSVIVTGTTTSGCVRATVLDAFSLNYRIALAEEGCFDRSPGEPRHQPLRHERQVRRRGEDLRGAGVLRQHCRAGCSTCRRARHRRRNLSWRRISEQRHRRVNRNCPPRRRPGHGAPFLKSKNTAMDTRSVVPAGGKSERCDPPRGLTRILPTLPVAVEADLTALWLERAGKSHPDRPAVGLGTRVLRSHGELAGRASPARGRVEEPLGPGARRSRRHRGQELSDYLDPRAFNAKLHGAELGYILEHSGARVCFASADLATRSRRMRRRASSG